MADNGLPIRSRPANGDAHPLTPENTSPVPERSPNATPHAIQSDGSSGSPRSPRSSLMLEIPSSSPQQTALAAVQYMPVPIVVLGPLKTVILSNEAMARLLCESTGSKGSTQERMFCEDRNRDLHGQTLSQIGIDLVHNEVPVWVDWESYIDTIGEDSKRNPRDSGDTTPTDVTPTATPLSDPDTLVQDDSKLDKTTVCDVAVDVVISPQRCAYPGMGHERRGGTVGLSCSMIISTWWASGAKHYTLTFVSATPNKLPAVTTPTTRHIPKSNRSHGSPGSLSSSSSQSGRRSQSASSPSSTLSSPSPYIPNFPPQGPMSGATSSTSASVLQKATRLRGALLNAMTLPCYALWKDQTVGIPNKALMELCSHDPGQTAGSDFLSQFIVWDERFEKLLPYDEYPIVELIRSEKSSYGKRIGLKDPKTAAPKVYECNCESVTDEHTGEFLGGIVILKDVTDYVDRIAAQQNINQQQFEYISNNIPPMVWTTTPTGSHDWFSDRWYQYTGLTPEESMGEGWAGVFHPDDMPATAARWHHSLATGDDYLTEYRARRRDGVWRWMLGRARAMRDDSGKITRWFGTCTDIHDTIEMRESSRRMREQLLRTMESANLTLCSVDLSGTITMIEGSNQWRNKGDPTDFNDMIGTNIFLHKDPMMTTEQHDSYSTPLRNILSGRSTDENCEFVAPNGKSFRHRYKPLERRTRVGGVDGETVLDGAIIVSSDITSMRKRETELRIQEKENAKLVANALAAKEASRLKSSFLANMSHEIRTPIAGVIGMAELLSDMNLDKEQAECAENILRSANGLLTVINDILDFSKVESGRLDIEEVQFSLSVVIRDLNKMLSFAALRKNLGYKTNIEPRIAGDLRVMGDPGRLRQIMTNVLTNSIKFTSEGHVSLSAQVRREDAEVTEVEFTVEDTGIGIEEEIRKKLFTPFSQADSSTARRFGGTGLGLTISKNLVELMHGSIRLESKLGVGTKCIFTIPFKKAEYMLNGSPLVNLDPIPDRLQSDMSVSISSDDRNGTGNGSPIASHVRRPSMFQGLGPPGIPQPPSSSSMENEEEHLTDADRARTHILVVEDNQVNQQIALKTIKKLKFSVSAVWNGQEAIDYVFADDDPNRPKPDIILMDCQMPVLDGYKATQRIRRQSHMPKQSRVPIVAMTASAIQGDKEKCMKAGMDDYLAKPVKGKILEKMLVKWALASRRRRSQTSKDPSAEPHITTIGMQAPASKSSAPVRPPLAHHGASSGDVSSSLSSHDGPEALFKHATLAMSQETEDASRQRRANFEERAMFLRDDKLLSAAHDPRISRHHSDEGEHHAASMRPSHALTKENVESYNDSMDGEQTAANDAAPEAGGGDPMRQLLGEKFKKKSKLSGSVIPDDLQTQRPSLPQKPHTWESERTVTK